MEEGGPRLGRTVIPLRSECTNGYVTRYGVMQWPPAGGASQVGPPLEAEKVNILVAKNHRDRVPSGFL